MSYKQYGPRPCNIETVLSPAVQAADTCQHSWTLKEAMSQPLEQFAKAKKSSHEDLETNSELETKLEEGSTASEDDMFLSIWFPSPPHFPKPYLHNRDFLDSKKARKYIMKHFNIENIKEGLWCYPDLSWDILYHNTFVVPDHFNSLQCYITKSIHKRNVALQIWSEHIARYIASDDLNPLFIFNVL